VKASPPGSLHPAEKLFPLTNRPDTIGGAAGEPTAPTPVFAHAGAAAMAAIAAAVLVIMTIRFVRDRAFIFSPIAFLRTPSNLLALSDWQLISASL
jgi:hypothetical protein